VTIIGPDMNTTISTPADLIGLVGQPLGTSSWRPITQDQVNLFADATDDHQWIHVDPERAAQGPFGTTIAHGYLTLSLAPSFISEVIEIEQLSAALNYGLNKVRFPAPVPVGSRVRGVLTLESAQPRGPAIEATVELVIELEGSERPACVAMAVVLYQ
jgi:acyl dehydratase